MEQMSVKEFKEKYMTKPTKKKKIRCIGCNGLIDIKEACPTDLEGKYICEECRFKVS